MSKSNHVFYFAGGESAIQKIIDNLQSQYDYLKNKSGNFFLKSKSYYGSYVRNKWR